MSVELSESHISIFSLGSGQTKKTAATGFNSLANTPSKKRIKKIDLDVEYPLSEDPEDEDENENVALIQNNKADKRTQPLKRWEINYCRREHIDFLHPIRNKVKTRHIVPFIGWYCWPKKKNHFEQVIKLCFDKEFGIPKDSGEMEALYDDPYILYGYGICEYFDRVDSQIILLTILTIMSLPLLLIYNSGVYYQGQGGLSQYSIGSLGASSVYCGHKDLPKSKIDLICPSGLVF